TQADRRLRHRVRRGIGARVGASYLAEDGRDLRLLAHGVILPVELQRGLLGGRSGQGRRHVEKVTLVDAGQELTAEPGYERKAGEERQQSGGQSEGRPAEREVHERPVEAHEAPRERVFELRRDTPAQEAVA